MCGRSFESGNFLIRRSNVQLSTAMSVGAFRMQIYTLIALLLSSVTEFEYWSVVRLVWMPWCTITEYSESFNDYSTADVSPSVTELGWSLLHRLLGMVQLARCSLQLVTSVNHLVRNAVFQMAKRKFSHAFLIRWPPSNRALYQHVRTHVKTASLDVSEEMVMKTHTEPLSVRLCLSILVTVKPIGRF